MFCWVRNVERRTTFRNEDVLFITMTRFDVVMPSTPGAAALRSEGRLEPWTAERVEIFRRTCLPSMLQQQPRPHAWIILFDKRVTPPVAQLLEELLDHDWIIPMLFGDDWAKHYADETRDVLRRRFGHRQPRFLACTRLDSDDAIHRSFHGVTDLAISKLRKTWTADTSLCLNYPYGVMWCGDMPRIRLKEKQFFALVEPFDSFRTPYRWAHTKIDQHVPVLDVFTEQPMWVYHAHHQNISGDKSCEPFERFAEPERILAYFGLRPDAWRQERQRVTAQRQFGVRAWSARPMARMRDALRDLGERGRRSLVIPARTLVERSNLASSSRISRSSRSIGASLGLRTSRLRTSASWRSRRNSRS